MPALPSALNRSSHQRLETMPSSVYLMADCRVIHCGMSSSLRSSVRIIQVKLKAWNDSTGLIAPRPIPYNKDEMDYFFLRVSSIVQLAAIGDNSQCHRQIASVFGVSVNKIGFHLLLEQQRSTRRCHEWRQRCQRTEAFHLICVIDGRAERIEWTQSGRREKWRFRMFVGLLSIACCLLSATCNRPM